MARVLGKAQQAMRIQDPVSGSVITLYYRLPSSEERVAYQTAAFRLEGGERQLRLGEARLTFGLQLLSGFEIGDFLVMDNGKPVPLDPEVHPNWKERLGEEAPDLVSYLAQQVFEGMRVTGRGGPGQD